MVYLNECMNDLIEASVQFPVHESVYAFEIRITKTALFKQDSYRDTILQHTGATVIAVSKRIW